MFSRAHSTQVFLFAKYVNKITKTKKSIYVSQVKSNLFTKLFFIHMLYCFLLAAAAIAFKALPYFNHLS